MRQVVSMHGVRAAFAFLTITLALNGCSLHRKPQPFLMPPFTPVELAKLPEPAEQPMIEGDDDDDDLPPVPVAEGASVPKRQKRKVVVVKAPAPVPDVPVTPPVQVGSTNPESESASVIGDFTPGGDQDPKTQREAADLIAANEKRLGGLSADMVRTQAALVSNVRNFQKQAQQALKTGDAAGAKTLATKGKLLLDDLDRTGS